MNMKRRCMLRLDMSVRRGDLKKHIECMRIENIKNFEQDSFFPMHSLTWSFSDLCTKSTLLPNMVPSILMQFIIVPFQITLNIFYRPTPLFWVTETLVNIMRRCMWRQWISCLRKGWLEEIHWRSAWKHKKNLSKIHLFSCTPLSDPFLIYAEYPHFSQTWFLLCNSSMCLFKLLSTSPMHLLL